MLAIRECKSQQLRKFLDWIFRFAFQLLYKHFVEGPTLPASLDTLCPGNRRTVQTMPQGSFVYLNVN